MSLLDMHVHTDDSPDADISAAELVRRGLDAGISAIGETVVLGDRYQESLVDYICARALGEEAQDKRDLARSDAHFEQFIIKAGLPRNLVVTGRRA